MSLFLLGSQNLCSLIFLDILKLCYLFTGNKHVVNWSNDVVYMVSGNCKMVIGSVDIVAFDEKLQYSKFLPIGRMGGTENVIIVFLLFVTQEPFSHESLLLDQQDTRLTKREKRLAQQGYEMDKKMANRPSYFPRPLVGGMPVRLVPFTRLSCS